MTTATASRAQPPACKASVKNFDDAVCTLFQIFGVDTSDGPRPAGTAGTSALATELQVRRCLQELLLHQEAELRDRQVAESLRRQELWRQAQKASQRRRRDAQPREAVEEQRQGLAEREAALAERLQAQEREERLAKEQQAETQRLASWEAQLREREAQL
eukprot:CAMPEP_0171222982 /NCGR_PEP_ID=MMETSP0790-20130122/35543_1 /TAXON_ID=2925 /ORGANISM="Alexandrium catenella, Strain OF101" /LENGTH=159 /DNA_ID=CAMNT_0011688943 /DNA_START=36 /DNA_END=511 /DNA_ORIENTATION=-